MAMPNYQEMYFPLLDFLKDKKQHSNKEIRDYLAVVFKVPDEDRKIMLKSNHQTLFVNRVGWTTTYLKQAGLIKSVARGVFTITDSGIKLLSTNPTTIDNKTLAAYPSFKEFLKKKDISDKPKTEAEVETKKEKEILLEGTPQEAIEVAFSSINSVLEADLLEAIMKQDDSFFEMLVVTLIDKMGYGYIMGAGKVVGKSGDGGIDGIIQEDKLGFNHIYIQAKRWNKLTSIGKPELQKFVGAIAGAKAGVSKGLFITTARFTKDAKDYIRTQHTINNVVLIDGAALVKLMIEHNVGVETQQVYELKSINIDFFESVET